MLSDIDMILCLHKRYQIESISEEDKKDGFITTQFSYGQMENLINEEGGLVIAEVDNTIVAYAMAASWEFWGDWPMFRCMADILPKVTFKNVRLSRGNTYQYGPVCVDGAFRGTGVFEKIYSFSLSIMEKKYPFAVTFINKKNPRSFSAHTRKVKMEVIENFEFNGNKYWMLASLCSQ